MTSLRPSFPSVVLAVLSALSFAACDGATSAPTDTGPARDGGTSSGRDAATVGPDGATSDAASEPDAWTVPPGMVDVVVAVGRGGRSTISCDEGRSWIENRLETAADVRCWGQPDGAEPEFLDAAHTMPNPRYLECDHDEGNSTGLVFHDGAFFRAIGWGTPGRTQRSVDGVTWEVPSPSFEATYNGLVAFDDALVAMGTPQPYLSSDDGASWTASSGELGWDVGHVRAATSSSYGPMGTIVYVTDDGIGWTDDRAATFHGPDAPACDGRTFASGGGVTVHLGSNGSACVTSDGGRTWQTHAVASSVAAGPVWNGHAFHFWGDGASGFAHFSSLDGVTWTSAASTRVGVSIVGVTVAGGFVGVNEIWNGGYEHQRFFRSDDGDTWETLATDGSAFTPGHPISHFASGVVPANAYCHD